MNVYLEAGGIYTKLSMRLFVLLTHRCTVQATQYVANLFSLWDRHRDTQRGWE